MINNLSIRGTPPISRQGADIWGFVSVTFELSKCQRSLGSSEVETVGKRPEVRQSGNAPDVNS